MQKVLVGMLAALLLASGAHAQLTSLSSGAAPAQGNVFLVGTGGVTLNKLVKLDASGLAVVAATTSDKTILGIAQATASSGAYVPVLTSSTQASCVFDNATTIGHFVTISPATAGDCSDTGVAASGGISALSSGITVVGVVQAAVSLGATAPIQLYGAGSQSAAGGSGCVPSVTTGFLLVGGSSSTCPNSHVDEGVTTAGTVTSSFPFAINCTTSACPSQFAITYNTLAVPVAGSSTTVVYAVDSAGHGEISEAAGSFSRLCTAGNSQCSGAVSSVFGRTGAVTATTGDYTVAQVTGAAPLASPTFTGTVTLPAGQVVNGVTLTTGGGTTNFLRADGTYAAPSGTGNTTSTSLTNNTVPRANGANSIIDSAFTDNGTVGGFARAGGFNPTHLWSGDINTCPDTSGSGTAQVCNTVGSFTPTGTPASCVIYTTTTTNSGTGLTVNINSLSAKSVAIAGASGWTTTLTAGIVSANKPSWMCYDGTNWDLMQTGTAAAGGSTTWNSIGNPTGNQSINMGNFTTTQTFGAATGATTPMWNITDTASNTGTGPVMKISTAASSQGFPMQLFQRGTSIFTVGATGGGTGSGFAGSLFVNSTTNAQAAGLYVGGQGVYAVGTSFFATLASASTSFEISTYNTAQTSGTGSGITFDAQNSSFAPIAVAGISGVLTATAGVNLTGDMVFCTSNNTACTEQMRLKSAGNLIVVGTVTSNLGTAAITSATPAAGVTSATCATAACTVSRGTYTVVGGTGTTGTFVTLLWPTTTTAWACSVAMNGGTGFLGLGHSVATATGMTVSAGVTILGTTFSFDYECQP